MKQEIISIPDSIITDIAESERHFCETACKCDSFDGAKALATGYEMTFDTLLYYFGKKTL